MKVTIALLQFVKTQR